MSKEHSSAHDQSEARGDATGFVGFLGEQDYARSRGLRADADAKSSSTTRRPRLLEMRAKAAP